MQAVRHNRYVILPKDFEAGWKDHVARSNELVGFVGYQLVLCRCESFSIFAGTRVTFIWTSSAKTHEAKKKDRDFDFYGFWAAMSPDSSQLLHATNHDKQWQTESMPLLAEKQMPIIMPQSFHYPSSIHIFIATLIPSPVWPQPSRCRAFDLWIYGAKKKIEESALALRFRVGVPNGFLCAANSSTVKQSLQLYEKNTFRKSWFTQLSGCSCRCQERVHRNDSFAVWCDSLAVREWSPSVSIVLLFDNCALFDKWI